MRYTGEWGQGPGLHGGLSMLASLCVSWPLQAFFSFSDLYLTLSFHLYPLGLLSPSQLLLHTLQTPAHPS